MTSLPSLSFYGFTSYSAVGVAVDKCIETGGVSDDFSGSPRLALVVDSHMSESDDVVSAFCLCCIDGVLNSFIELLACLVVTEVVDIIAFFILEESRRRFCDGFRCADTYESDLLSA